MKDPFEESGNPAEETPTPSAASTATAEAASAPEVSELETRGISEASSGGTKRQPTKHRKAMPKRRTAGRPHPKRHGEPPHVVHHYESIIEEGESDSFFGRHRAKIIIGVLVLVVVVAASFVKPGSGPVAKAPERMVSIQLPPLPPPPPPPKIPPPPPKEEKAPEQAPIAAPEKKPEAAKPKPADKPPEGLGTNLKGQGPGLAGLGGSGNGMLGGTGTGGGGGSVAAWYAGQVQAKIAEALRRSSKTRNASIKGLKFSVSVDGTGRVTDARLLASSGNAGLDDAIKNEVLTNIQLQEPPPGGKPMTITMILNARRPN